MQDHNDNPYGNNPVQSGIHPQPPQGGVYPVQPVHQQPVQPYGTVPQGFVQTPGSTFAEQVAAVPQTAPKKIPDRKSVASKMIELVYLFLIILESVLALRFIFKLLGGDPDNVFIQFLYNATLVFTYPFQGLFGSPIQNRIAVARYDLEFTTLVAMGIYALIAYIVVRIIDIFR